MIQSNEEKYKKDKDAISNKLIALNKEYNEYKKYMNEKQSMSEDAELKINEYKVKYDVINKELQKLNKEKDDSINRLQNAEKNLLIFIEKNKQIFEGKDTNNIELRDALEHIDRKLRNISEAYTKKDDENAHLAQKLKQATDSLDKNKE